MTQSHLLPNGVWTPADAFARRFEEGVDLAFDALERAGSGVLRAELASEASWHDYEPDASAGDIAETILNEHGGICYTRGVTDRFEVEIDG